PERGRRALSHDPAPPPARHRPALALRAGEMCLHCTADQPGKGKPSMPLRRWYRPCVEALEDRCVPSTFTVTNLKDDGSDGCLRAAIAKANDLVHHPGLDTILFKPGLEGTMKLTGGQITISDDLTLVGPGAALVAVDGNASDRLFNISNGVGGADLDVTIQGLELRNGKTTTAGAAIFGEETLTLIRDVIDDNRAERVGAVVAGGNLAIKKSLITGNRSLTNVGAVYFYGNASPTASFTLTVKGSTISGNTT